MAKQKGPPKEVGTETETDEVFWISMCRVIVLHGDLARNQTHNLGSDFFQRWR